MRTLLIAIFLALAVPAWAPAIVDVPAADCCCAKMECDVHVPGASCGCPLPASVSAQSPAILAADSFLSAPPASDVDFFSVSGFAPERTDRPQSPPPKFTA